MIAQQSPQNRGDTIERVRSTRSRRRDRIDARCPNVDTTMCSRRQLADMRCSRSVDVIRVSRHGCPPSRRRRCSSQRWGRQRRGHSPTRGRLRNHRLRFPKWHHVHGVLTDLPRDEFPLSQAWLCSAGQIRHNTHDRHSIACDGVSRRVRADLDRFGQEQRLPRAVFVVGRRDTPSLRRARRAAALPSSTSSVTFAQPSARAFASTAASSSRPTPRPRYSGITARSCRFKQRPGRERREAAKAGGDADRSRTVVRQQNHRRRMLAQGRAPVARARRPRSGRPLPNGSLA